MRIFGTARLLQIGRSRSVRLGAVALACAVAVGGSAQSVSPIPVAEQQSIRTLNDAPNPDTARNASDIRRVAKPTPQTPADPNAAVCVGANEATLDKVFVAMFDSFLPSIPAAHRTAALAAKRQVLADMHSLKISTLAVSLHPSALGASPEAPINTYRDPLSQYIVTQLMNAKNGRYGQTMRVENLTLSQAVESAWLYFYLTAVIPLTFLKDTMPSVTAVGPVSLGMLITLPITIGVAGLKMMYTMIGNAIIDGCIVKMTPDERRHAGQPDPDLSFASKVPQIIADIAGQVEIAEPGSCPAIGDLPLSRIVTRTADYLTATAPNPAAAKQIANSARDLQKFMKTVWVPHNLIPADPDDLSTVETLLSYGMGVIPTVGGTITDIVIGLGHNSGSGKNMGEMVRLSDLTVTKTMTAAYYAYALTTQFISIANEYAADALVPLTGGLDLLPRVSGLINAPNTYGLVVYHSVLRSLCLSEDRKVVPASQPAARW
ncbi:MAG: hypothetical protein WBG39_13805 [Gordonia sp. (in: high G+C Gram-positive bacteria)]